MRWRQIGLIMLLVTQLSACGFHLRGFSGDDSAADGEYAPVTVQQNHSDNVLRRLINQQLAAHGITSRTSDEGQITRISLRISDIARGDTVLSLDADIRTAERLLMLTAKLSLWHSDGELLQSTTLQEQRILFTNPDNPVGNSAEQTLLVSEMENAIARRIAQQASRWLDGEQASAAATGSTR